MLNSRGFTIVEVLVAMLVLTVGLLGTVSAFAAITRAFDLGHASITASAHAAELLESARAASCGGSASGARDTGFGVFAWHKEDISGELQLVTVVFHPRHLRARADTFSAILPC